MIAVMNAKGGCGATFVASNVAHMLDRVEAFDGAPRVWTCSSRASRSTSTFSLEARPHASCSRISPASTRSRWTRYFTKHAQRSGLFSARPRRPSTSARIAPPRSLIWSTSIASHEHIVVDMPRRVDPYVATVLRRAHQVVLVLQHRSGHLRDAARMLQMLVDHGVKESKSWSSSTATKRTRRSRWKTSSARMRDNGPSTSRAISRRSGKHQYRRPHL